MPGWQTAVVVGVVLMGVGGVSGGCAGRRPARGALPAGMVPIPAGELEMGDASGSGYPDQRPVHRVAVGGFFMDRLEVTWALWDEVFAWAQTNGYGFDEAYDFHPARSRLHPVCNVSWHDAVKWCNARSEHSGRTPVYCLDSDRTQVYRAGREELTAAMVRWKADGFRLPTEVEWEWAARGGWVGGEYPWPGGGKDLAAVLDSGRANYWQSGDPWESDAECATSPAGYFNGGQTPWGPDMANGYGLHDAAGNVAEWCWDWYHDRWYADPAASQPNTRGPTWGYGRVIRGGSWISNENYCRVAARYMSAADYRCHCYGFRCVVAPAGGRP